MKGTFHVHPSLQASRSAQLARCDQSVRPCSSVAARRLGRRRHQRAAVPEPRSSAKRAAIAPRPAACGLAGSPDGRIHNGQFDFDDWGLTIDTAFALAAAGGDHRRCRGTHGRHRAQLLRRLRRSSGDERYAGAMAKTLLARRRARAEPTHFGGHNLRHQVLAARRRQPVRASRPVGCATSARSDDFSNTFTQAYAVLGLARTGDVPQDVVNYLLKQQCSDGYFRLTEVAGETCDDSRQRADVDATALAVQALLAAHEARSCRSRYAFVEAASVAGVRSARQRLLQRRHRTPSVRTPTAPASPRRRCTAAGT